MDLVMDPLFFCWTSAAVLLLVAILLAVAAIWVLVAVGRYSVFGMSTDANSGDVDDSFALTYVVRRGFFVDGAFSFTLALVRWYVPFLKPYTIRIALESKGDLKLLVEQMSTQVYGRVSRVQGGFLTANFELIELYQSGYKVVFPSDLHHNYELFPVGGDLRVDLLEIAGPTSCSFNTTGDLLYVGRLSLHEGQSVDKMTGANAGELSRECVESALRNGARVRQLPVQFSRGILCSLPHSSPLLATAAQLQLNPWALSFLQTGPAAQQFAESNRNYGALLLEKMGLTYESVWEKLDRGVKGKVETLAAKFPDWGPHIARDRILWAVVNLGGRFPWLSDTSVRPPFSELWRILVEAEKMDPLELFEFRIVNVSRFTGLEEERVRTVLSHGVLYDLYGVVLLKYRLSAETVAANPQLFSWFKSQVQTFADSIPSR